MSDSLILAGVELIGGSAGYRLGQGHDYGEPIPDTTTISSLLLDGDRVVGARTKNRQVVLPVWVSGTSRADLTAKVSSLLQAIDAATFTLQWTPDGGLSVVYDAFRGTGTRSHDLVVNAQNKALVTLAFDALPFGRSVDAQTITSGGANVQVDAMDTAPTGATADTTFKSEGTASALTAWASGVTAGAVSRSIASTNLSSYVSLRVRLAHDSADTTITATLTLTDTSARTYVIPAAGAGVGPASPFAQFADVYFNISDGAGAASLAVINKWSVALKRTGRHTTPPAENTWLDDLRALASGSALTSTARGSVQLVPGVQGTARAPGTFVLNRSAGLSAALLHRPPLDQQREAQILIGLLSTVASQTVNVPAPNASWLGTYTLVMAVKANAANGVAQTLEVGFTETWGTTVSVTLSETVYTFSYSSLNRDRLLVLGQVTLPIRKVADRTHMASAVRVANTAGGDRYYDLMLLDTRGQTVLIDGNLPFPTQYLRVTEPDPAVGFGDVQALYSDNGTPTTPPWGDAVSIMDVCTAISGGPMLLEPGANKLLAYATDSAPTLTSTLYPRWLDERTA